MTDSIKIAIIQSPPVFQNLEKSLERAISCIDEASSKGANLIVFGETWLSGYPAWIDHSLNYALWDHKPTKDLFRTMYQNSVDINGDEIKTLSKACKKHSIILCMGINEIDKTIPGTIYNSVIIINQEGRIALHHRKLMPTFTEKLLYGLGDGRGLHSAPTPYGNIGALICWEHWMPLTRQAIHQSGEIIHIALWPQVHEMLQIASRHYAFEGRCYVIAAGQLLRASDLPETITLKDELLDNPDTFVLNGGSSVIGPDGFYLLEPQYEGPEMILHEINDISSYLGERMNLDVTGHYNRPDVFEFGWREVV